MPTLSPSLPPPPPPPPPPGKAISKGPPLVLGARMNYRPQGNPIASGNGPQIVAPPPPAAKAVEGAPPSSHTAPPAGPSPPPPSSSAAPTTAAAAIKGSDVVAPGATMQFLQLPSPVYLALWVTDDLVAIGAGGGGSRFGMANVLVLLRVCTAAGSGTVTLSPAQREAVERSRPPSAASPTTMWTFVSALDLGPNIPWCVSPTALPNAYLNGTYEDVVSPPWTRAQQECMSNMVSFFVVSSIRTFTLIGVESTRKPSSLPGGEDIALRQLAHITIPNDAENPDKKPVALVSHAVAVAHDHNGIQLYDLTSLLPTLRDPATGSLVPVLTASPLAEWALPARVNDICANRINSVIAKRRGGGDGEDVKALVVEYIMIAAAVQDKTVRIGSFRQRRRYDRQPAAEEEKVHTSSSPAPIRAVVKEEAVLSGADCGLPFTLMTSSLRLVRMVGLDSTGAYVARARELLTAASLQSQLRRHVASLLIIAYDQRGNMSYAVRVAASLADDDQAANSKHQQSKSSVTSLKFRFDVEGKPSPVAKDAITCLCPLVDRSTLTSSSRSDNVFGAVLPSRWLCGTVEGTVTTFGPMLTADGKEHAADAHNNKSVPASDAFYVIERSRPSLDRRAAKKHPALHREPVTAVAVNSKGDVISTDLAQKAAISTLRSAADVTVQLFPTDVNAQAAVLEALSRVTGMEVTVMHVVAVVLLALAVMLCYPVMILFSS